MYATEEERAAARYQSRRKWVEKNRAHLREYDRQRRIRDLEKRKAQARTSYQKNADKRRLYTRLQAQERMEWLNGIASFLGCFVCGDENPVHLEWHHLVPLQGKQPRLTSILTSNGYDAAIKEMNRCVVLCANCHNDVHHWIKLDMQD